MPPWMNTEKQLLDYMDLSAFTVVQKIDGLYVDGTPYSWDTTITALKAALAIGGTGDYDPCVIDLIDNIDGNGKVWIETNSNFILIDAIAETIVDIIVYKNQSIREMNPLLATFDFGLEYWQTMFNSERQEILGIPETDAEYMIRVVAELFALTTSLLNIDSIISQFGLQPYVVINTRNDPFQFNKNMWPYSVNIHLHGDDEDKIESIRNVFFRAAAAGIRPLIICDIIDSGEDHSYCANFGGGTVAGASGYVPVSEFTT